jgi:hypothetical protein
MLAGSDGPAGLVMGNYRLTRPGEGRAHAPRPRPRPQSSGEPGIHDDCPGAENHEWSTDRSLSTLTWGGIRGAE